MSSDDKPTPRVRCSVCKRVVTSNFVTIGSRIQEEGDPDTAMRSTDSKISFCLRCAHGVLSVLVKTMPDDAVMDALARSEKFNGDLLFAAYLTAGGEVQTTTQPSVEISNPFQA